MLYAFEHGNSGDIFVQKAPAATMETLARALTALLGKPDHPISIIGTRHGEKKHETLLSREEMAHADLLAKRIIELGGEPNFSPDGLAARSHAEYVEGDSLRSMITEDLIAERIAIESYREMIAYLGNRDPSTLRMLEEILASEEEHAENLASLLKGMQDYGKV